MKRFLSLLITFLLTAFNPLFADQPTPEGQSQNQAIAAQLAPLYKEQFHLLRSNDLLYKTYEESNGSSQLSLSGIWGKADDLFNERKGENFSYPANILDALGQEYALHLDVIKRSYGTVDAGNSVDQIASSLLSVAAQTTFNNFVQRLPKVSADDLYSLENHDATKMISNEELRQHSLPNIVAMEASFLKMELFSLLKDIDASKEAPERCNDFIQSLDYLPVDNYNDLVAAQHKIVDLENEIKGPLSASAQAMKSMENQERGVEMWSHVDDGETQRAEPSLETSPTDAKQESLRKEERNIKGFFRAAVLISVGELILQGPVGMGIAGGILLADYIDPHFIESYCPITAFAQHK